MYVVMIMSSSTCSSLFILCLSSQPWNQHVNPQQHYRLSYPVPNCRNLIKPGSPASRSSHCASKIMFAVSLNHQCLAERVQSDDWQIREVSQQHLDSSLHVQYSRKWTAPPNNEYSAAVSSNDYPCHNIKVCKCPITHSGKIVFMIYRHTKHSSMQHFQENSLFVSRPWGQNSQVRKLITVEMFCIQCAVVLIQTMSKPPSLKRETTSTHIHTHTLAH